VRGLRHGGLGLTLVLVLLMVVWVLFLARGTTFGPAVDNPKDFLITTLNGVTAAGLYFVVASGFTLIFGLMRVVNMAHGAFFLLGGYIALKLQRHWVGEGAVFGLTSDQVNLRNWVLPTLIGALLVGAVGLGMQQAFLRWNQGQELRQALITIAISIILADQMLAHFGGVAEDIAWPRDFDKFVNLRLQGIQYTETRLIILAIALAIGGALWLWLKRTRTGMVIRYVRWLIAPQRTVRRWEISAFRVAADTCARVRGRIDASCGRPGAAAGVVMQMRSNQQNQQYTYVH